MVSISAFSDCIHRLAHINLPIGNKWNHDKFLPYRVMLDKIEQTYNAAAANTDNNNIHTTTNVIRMQDEANDTSKAYKVSGYAGKFGFITSMSSNFCGTCNRLRVTADGSMKVCLFGNAEVSLRDAMRNESMSDDDILKIVQGAGRKRRRVLLSAKETPKVSLSLTHFLFLL